MVSELSPARIELLKQAVDTQEKCLAGCVLIFCGLRQSSDPEVVSISEQALMALVTCRDTLEAMVDGLHETRH